MSSHTHADHPQPRGPSSPARFLAIPAVIGGLALGLWFFGAIVAPGYTASIGLSIGWFVLAGLIIGRVAKRWPAVKTPMRATFAAVAAAAAFGFYWTSIRDDRVNEQVVTGVAASRAAPARPAAPTAGNAPAVAPPATNVEVARGQFETRAHSSHGTAAVVALAGGGRRLTLTDFDTSNGPDLRVYLVKGPLRGDGDVHGAVDLGRLKGNVGNQQYKVRDDVDIAAYSTVVIWCRAFSVSFAQADLRAS